MEIQGFDKVLILWWKKNQNQNKTLTFKCYPLPGDALVDATPLHRVNSYQARTAVILTFDAEQTRDRIMKAVREGSTSSSGSGGTSFYFTEIPKRTKVNRQTHTEDEMRNEAGSSQRKKMKTSRQLSSWPLN